jgi:hypothetical protein
MSSLREKLPIRDEKLIEIDNTPDLSQHKPIVILKREEFVKLLTNLEVLKESWIAMRFNDSIFVVWRELIFLHVEPYPKEH